MAAFLHASPDGNRFNSSELGAWYAAFELRTAVAEVAHHFRRELYNTGKQAAFRDYRNYASRLEGDFEDLRGTQDTNPGLFDRESYIYSQLYGEEQRASGADGIVYDSLRLVGGTKVVAYRPSKILEVMQLDHWRLTVSLDAAPIVQKLNS